MDYPFDKTGQTPILAGTWTLMTTNSEMVRTAKGGEAVQVLETKLKQQQFLFWTVRILQNRILPLKSTAKNTLTCIIRKTSAYPLLLHHPMDAPARALTNWSAIRAFSRSTFWNGNPFSDEKNLRVNSGVRRSYKLHRCNRLDAY